MLSKGGLVITRMIYTRSEIISHDTYDIYI